MSQTLQARYSNGYETQSFGETSFGETSFAETSFAETPFADPRGYETLQEVSGVPAEAFAATWEVTTPFASTEWSEAGETEATTQEVGALAELATELKDSEFREALEQLADEALEIHAEQLAGEYGDRETRDVMSERLLQDHFQPLIAHTDALLDRFAEQLEGYQPGTLTEMEIERIAGEILPVNQPLSPASEQFLGGFLRKVGKLASGALTAPLKLAGKGLALAGKLALGPLLMPLKKLARFLLGHVVKFAMNRIPVRLRPLARKLSERLFHELGDGHESEAEEHEQTEAEAIPSGPDVARLEAEFDLQVAQLLMTPDPAEVDHLVGSYGEEIDREYGSPLAALDRARAELTDGLARLRPGEGAQPAMEQFLPAIAAVWPALKGGIALIGRPRVVKFVGGLLAHLIKPILGAEFANALAPAIADAGLHMFGFETGPRDVRAVATEALAATIEETVTRLAEQPPHVFENETLLDAATREAFETAAATYFPAQMMRPELRETADQHGMWQRMPQDGARKRYAKYTETPAVTVTPKVAEAVKSFDHTTLAEHIHDRLHIPPGQTLKTNVRLYQALPGTRPADIARGEGIPRRHLHPLTPHAASALLGKNAGLGMNARLGTGAAPHGPVPHKLHVHQRLYYIEPPGGRQHRHHVRLARAELFINLPKGEIRIWLYLGERLCQQISTELAKTNNEAAAFRLVKKLLHRPAEMLRAAVLERHLPPTLRLVSEVPQLDSTVPTWLKQVGHQLAAKFEEWVSEQVVQYFRNNAEEFRRIAAAHHDGITLRITMSRIPGMETLRLVARGRIPRALEGSAWLKGTPAFAVHARAGYSIR
jgi:hypothetical protein